MPATDFESALYEQLGTDIGAFADGATTVAGILGASPNTRLYAGGAPDFPSWPGTFAVLRILDPMASDFGGQERLDFTIELMYYGRPRGGTAGKTKEVLRLASLVDGALLRKTVATTADGLVRVTGREGGGLLPAGTGDMDREVVQYLARYSAFTYPRWLTKYAAP